MGLISLCNSQEIEAMHGFVVLQRPQAPLKAKSRGWVEMKCMLLTQRFNFQQERSGGVLYFLVSSCQGGMSFWNGCVHQAGFNGGCGMQWPLLERRSQQMISWSLLALNLMTPFLCCLVKQNAVPEGSAPIPFCMMKEFTSSFLAVCKVCSN